MDKRYFWIGCRDMAAFVLIILPFGMLFGALATEAGFDILQALAISITVFAGAAQFTAVALINEQAPTFIILLASLAVNLRMAIYSAGLLPHFGKLPFWSRALVAYTITDQSYALVETRTTKERLMTLPQKTGYYFGGVAFILPTWLIAVLTGALIGARIPESFALDFALPILFIALFAPMIRSLPHLIGAFISASAALVFAGLPYSLGLIVAASLAVICAAEAERRLGGHSNG